MITLEADEVVVRILLKNFVEMAWGFFRYQGDLDVSPESPVGVIVLDVLHKAGFDPHSLGVKKLLGYYMDSDGSCTGETYIINTYYPFVVLKEHHPSFDRVTIEDNYRATLWLEQIVKTGLGLLTSPLGSWKKEFKSGEFEAALCELLHLPSSGRAFADFKQQYENMQRRVAKAKAACKTTKQKQLFPKET